MKTISCSLAAVNGQLHSGWISDPSDARGREHQYLALSTPACGDGVCVPPYADDYGFFADASCKTRLLARGAGATPAVVAHIADGYHAVGPAWKGAVFEGTSGSYELMPSPPSFDYFEVGPAIDSSEIAKIYFSYQGTGRLQIATLQSGATTLAVGKVGVPGEWVLFDSTLGKKCQPVRTPSDDVRCFTGSLAIGEHIAPP